MIFTFVWSIVILPNFPPRYQIKSILFQSLIEIDGIISKHCGAYNGACMIHKLKIENFGLLSLLTDELFIVFLDKFDT